MILPNSLAASCRDQAMVPFIGAGFSMSAGLPSWRSLLDRLIAVSDVAISADLEGALDLPDVAELLESIGVTRRTAYEIFSSSLDDPRVQPGTYHEQLLDLAPRTTLTTNWDKLVEFSFRQRGRSLNTIASENQSPFFSMSGGYNLVKLHGCISNAESLVYRKSDYEYFWEQRKTMEALLRMLFSSQSIVFMGYGAGDPNILGLLDYLKNLGTVGAREHFALSFGDQALEARWDLLGVKVIDATNFGDKGDFESCTVGFLRALVESQSASTTNNSDRSRLVNEELSNQIRLRRPGATIRMRGSLGWLSNPEPDPGDVVYGHFEQDVIEYEMTRLVREFVQVTGGVVRMILDLNVSWMTSRYTPGQLLRRIEALESNAEVLGANLEVALSSDSIAYNQMIFDDSSSVFGFKIPSNSGIPRVSVRRDHAQVVTEVENFDSDFNELIQDPRPTPLSIQQSREAFFSELTKARERLTDFIATSNSTGTTPSSRDDQSI